MVSPRSADISKFFIAGINYKKSDASIRGMYAITKDQYQSLLLKAAEHNITSFFILSTCNRTEIYGFANDALTISSLLCSETKGSLESFQQQAYIKNGTDAVNHLFSVAAGLDSQILGDYEIIGQIKDAVKFSKKMNFINVFMERLVNAVLQASKNIKTNTQLSGGTVSVAFAAVQYIKETITNIADKKILLVGTGKIGRNTSKNIIDYLNTKNVTLINRNEDKAIELAAELGLQSASLDNLLSEAKAANIILVASNGAEPVILKSFFNDDDTKLIIDLSIPYNVETTTGDLKNITLVNVDQLSKINDETFQRRLAEVPKAKEIIGTHMAEFTEWYQMRRHVPVLRAVKIKLEQLHNCNMYNAYSARFTTAVVNTTKEDTIQKVITGMAVKMRTKNQQGCFYIEALNEYIGSTASN